MFRRRHVPSLLLALAACGADDPGPSRANVSAACREALAQPFEPCGPPRTYGLWNPLVACDEEVLPVAGLDGNRSYCAGKYRLLRESLRDEPRWWLLERVEPGEAGSR